MLLAAGLGTRLHPLTETLPKCLMPIGRRPLMDYWLAELQCAGIKNTFVNVHAHSNLMRSYLSRPTYASWVHPRFEERLVGTAGTIRELASALAPGSLIVAHADNLVSCDFAEFVEAHLQRTKGTVITMMTFLSPTPTSCGVVNVDERGVVTHMEEKPTRPKTRLANGAVYIFEQEVVNFICEGPVACDISTEVLPHFFGRIQTWHNRQVHRDIGTVDQLRAAQHDSVSKVQGPEDAWQTWYEGSQEFKSIQGYLLQ